MLGALASGAFLVGLLGGVHCIGMCGGIALTLSKAGEAPIPAWQVHAGYNLGRVASYTLAGAVAGAVGGGGLLLHGVLPVQLGFYVLANVLLVGLGLYLGGWSRLVARLEIPGRWLWRHVQPRIAPLLPADSLPKALAVGALWGWLPCGLVYSLLATALLAGSAAGGAAVMLAFGIGTLPNLMAAGMALGRVRTAFRRQAVRQLAGVVVAGFGLVGLARAADLGDHIRRGLLCLM
jgi:sulfite exporter TauE/SafE